MKIEKCKLKINSLACIVKELWIIFYYKLSLALFF
jgi:hypothetical protein